MGKSKFLKPDITTSQNLATGDLDYTTSIGRAFKLDQIIIHFSVAVTETITITLDSKNGANYDTVLRTVDLSAEQDFIFKPSFEANYQAGDEIRVQCTNANLTGVAYAILKTSEV
jgi:hypothetical protein